VLAQIGGKAQALTLINSLLAPDIDLDDDGKKDAISVGIGFESVPGPDHRHHPRQVSWQGRSGTGARLLPD
jgi:hypothetical protein